MLFRSALIAVLDTRDPELRSASAREAARIRERTPRARIDEPALDRAVDRELRSAYQTLATIEDLDLPPDDLLAEALEVRYLQKRDLAFRLLQVRYPGRTMRLVQASLGAESPAVRANAVEVLENLLAREEARRIVPLLDELPRATRIQRGREVFGNLRRLSAEAWLPRLLDDPHPWTVTCTLRVVADRGLIEQRDRVVRLTQSRDPVVRETAFVTLARLGQEDRAARRTDDLERLARAAAVDPVREVRRAGSFLLEALTGPLATRG